MREIRFRTWEEAHKAMDYSPAIGGEDVNSGIRCAQRCDDVWMQFTGLKDKNGREIFEGDILGGEPPDRMVAKMQPPLVVEYVPSMFVARGRTRLSGPLHHCNEMMEVIGNIYENPELLK